MRAINKYVIFFIYFFLILFVNKELFSQGAGCNTADPFCTGTTATFPASVNNGTAAAGNDYGCLGSQPNPAWYYLQIDNPGSMTIDMSSNPAVDIDFALWGPFPDYPTAMGNCGSLPAPSSCSFSTAATETAVITGASTGQVYILLITNFSNSATDISFTNSSGTATTNCSILLPCLITSLTTNPTACNPATNTYGVSGSISFTDPPTTGTLTFTDCHGNNQVFNAPFTSPISYNIPGITANGVPCNVTAVFSSAPACTFTTNYATPAPCAVSCAMDSMPIAMTNCYNTPFLGYDVSGTVYFTNPPASGTLTITPCSGAPIVFNAPFGTSQAFNFTSLSQTGTNCAFTAVFSADAACTITTNFMSPPPITGFTTNQGACLNGVYNLNGTITFSNPPATGTLTISYNDGVTTIDTVINAPFSSPENWSITAPANGNNYTITAYFSGFPTCTMVSTGTAPPACGCVADIGTFTASISPNNGQTPYILCFGDQFTMTSNGDFVPPDIANSPPITPPGGYNPGIGYLIYSCPPTIALTPSTTFPNDWIGNDPCFVGLVGFGNSFNDINATGSPSYAGAWTNNTIYYVPITFYDTINGYYSYVNTAMPCYEMGPAFAVQYLTEITYLAVPDCQNSSVTVTISGGLPEADGSLYTASNLLPATASFVNTTATHGGNIVITGLQNGDNYSFDVVDVNGCPVTVTGGPFVGLPNANAGVNDTSCTLSYVLSATPSFGTGAWTGAAGVVFVPSNSPTATVTVPAAGTYTFTWTETNAPGCSSSDIVAITFNILSLANTPTNPSCNGGNDGQISLTPSGGAVPYNYQWDAAANNQITNPATNLPAGSFSVTVTDNFGCTIAATIPLTQPVAFSYTTASQNANCGFPDGWASVVNFAGGTGIYTYDWGAGPTSNDTLFNLTPNTYTVTVADANGCDTAFTITVGNSPSFTASITAFTDALCNGAANGTATADGSDPLANYNFSWNTVPTQLTQTATGLAAGTYMCTVTDANTGCTDTTSVVIGQPIAVSVNAGADVTICTSGNTTISATGAGGTPGYTYSWDNALGAGQSHTVSPIAQTTYIVTITDANGCTSTDAVMVSVYPPLIVVAVPDITVCPDGQVTVSAIATVGSGNGGPYTYSWDNGLGLGQSHNISPATTTTYTVTLSDGCSPNVTDQITVFVNPVPQVSFDVDMLSLCETPQQAFTFYNTTDITGGMVGSTLWNFGDGSTASGDTVSHTYAGPGVYDITLTVTSTLAAGGCTDSLTKPAYVQVFANPVADFTMNPNPTTMFDPTIHFLDQSYVNILYWTWDIAGLDTSILQNPSYTFPEDTGHYQITLTVVDNHDCENTITQTAIVTGEYGIYVPNAFTPDFDNLNDGFFPNGFGISDRDYTFLIFDRWGEIIFESHAKFTPWNGTYKGKLVQNGVYVWKLFFTDINGKTHIELGHVSIVK